MELGKENSELQSQSVLVPRVCLMYPKQKKLAE